ncbi:hypothetical protein CCP4SC76_2450006 [Gammaproteobacteria bacterium]
MWWKLLEIILGKIANPELVKQTGDLVQTAEQQGGTGAEKRTWVFNQLRPLAVNAGLSIAVSILNLLIEAAVSRLNVQKGVV